MNLRNIEAAFPTEPPLMCEALRNLSDDQRYEAINALLRAMHHAGTEEKHSVLEPLLFYIPLSAFQLQDCCALLCSSPMEPRAVFLMRNAKDGPNAEALARLIPRLYLQAVADGQCSYGSCEAALHLLEEQERDEDSLQLCLQGLLNSQDAWYILHLYSLLLLLHAPSCTDAVRAWAELPAFTNLLRKQLTQADTAIYPAAAMAAVGLCQHAVLPPDAFNSPNLEAAAMEALLGDEAHRTAGETLLALLPVFPGSDDLRARCLRTWQPYREACPRDLELAVMEHLQAAFHPSQQALVALYQEDDLPDFFADFERRRQVLFTERCLLHPTPCTLTGSLEREDQLNAMEYLCLLREAETDQAAVALTNSAAATLEKAGSFAISCWFSTLCMAGYHDAALHFYRCYPHILNRPEYIPAADDLLDPEARWFFYRTVFHTVSRAQAAIYRSLTTGSDQVFLAFLNSADRWLVNTKRFSTYVLNGGSREALQCWLPHCDHLTDIHTGIRMLALWENHQPPQPEKLPLWCLFYDDRFHIMNAMLHAPESSLLPALQMGCGKDPGLSSIARSAFTSYYRQQPDEQQAKLSPLWDKLTQEPVKEV